MSYTLIREKNVVLRKPKRCVWCSEIIPVGEIAYSHVYSLDGDFKDQKLHIECKSAMSNFYSDPNNHGEYFNEGDFKRGSIEMR